ncbi:MAG: hypothetical protein ACRCU6_01115 [Fusobacteriaceae bacterium]
MKIIPKINIYISPDKIIYSGVEYDLDEETSSYLLENNYCIPGKSEEEPKSRKSLKNEKSP